MLHRLEDRRHAGAVQPPRALDRRAHARAQEEIDIADLAAALTAAIEGEVRFDDATRALYATDASNYRQVPIGVVVPRSREDVVRTVAICRAHDAPVLSRGGGTSLCGQCCNVAVAIDFSKYLNRIVALDPERKIARVEPGVVLDDLRAAAKAHGLTFAPDPATHTHNTIGGMIGNNSCGPHSVMAGTTADNVLALDVLTYDGLAVRVGATTAEEFDAIVAVGGRRAELYTALRGLQARYADDIRRRFPPIPRRVSGYNLPALLPEAGFDLARALVGSEGTCAVVLEATVRLVDDPPARVLLALGYKDVFAAADHVPEVMAAQPIALEGIDDRLVQDMTLVGLHTGNLDLLPDGHGWLLVEFGGATEAQAKARAETLMTRLRGADEAPTMRLYDSADDMARVWTIRESGLGATAHVPGKSLTWEGWEDSAVPPERLGTYLRKLRALLDRYGYQGDLYGHFGQGCVHTRIDFDLETAAGIATYRRFIEDAARLVVSLGGSISGEHGDGQSKAELLPIMFGDALMRAFREFKAIWDPANKMNPGKVVGAWRADENLRLGTTYDPPQVGTHFAYPDDRNNFARAVLRCVGVGECRKKDGLMCPSYMTTGEEMHSTRGRARLLFEMLNGNTLKDGPLRGGWHEPAVKEALSLCLSCKGCKGECPVHVDMATYKAEFLAHYYHGRARPLAAYAFGRIDRWARLGARFPRVANFLTQTPALAALAKRAAGIAPQRQITPLAPVAFTTAYATRPPLNPDGPPVILWPDTFNNYFRPEVAEAAVAVLEGAGCAVRLPARPLCCGRPLYEFGMVDKARDYLHEVIAVLDNDIRDGTPIVGLEPACVSVFRDELPALLPRNEQARRLARQVFLLSEFLDGQAPRRPYGRLEGKALVQPHCHHRAVLKLDAERAVLEALGLDFEILDAGCCGMAGAFGFERDKYEVSIRCAERRLLPAVRRAPRDTLVIADGFSCGEQIRQATGRQPLHLAQVLHMAMNDDREETHPWQR